MKHLVKIFEIVEEIRAECGNDYFISFNFYPNSDHLIIEIKDIKKEGTVTIQQAITKELIEDLLYPDALLELLISKMESGSA